MSKQYKIFQPGGFVKPCFEEVKETFRKNLASGLEEGGSFSAYYKGELVVNLWGGEADALCRREWKENTVSVIYSVTKCFSAVVIAHLVERGYLNYKDPICKYWPEFGQNGKESITLEQFLCHKAGIPCVEDKDFKAHLLIDNPRKMGDILANLKPLWKPGEVSAYHSITFGLVLDQIVRRVDWKFRGLAQYFHEEIAEVFGLDIYIGLPKVLQHQCTKIALSSQDIIDEVERNEDSTPLDDDFTPLQNTGLRDWKHYSQINDPDLIVVPSGSSHGFATAAALAKFHSILAMGGKYNGKQLLSQATIDLFQKPLSWGREMTNGGRDIFSLGVMMRPILENNQVHFEFGHSGFGGQIGLADCKYKVGSAYITNHLNLISTAKQLQNSQYFLYKSLYRCIHRLEGVNINRQVLISMEDLQAATKSKL